MVVKKHFSEIRDDGPDAVLGWNLINEIRFALISFQFQLNTAFLTFCAVTKNNLCLLEHKSEKWCLTQTHSNYGFFLAKAHATV